MTVSDLPGSDGSSPNADRTGDADRADGAVSGGAQPGVDVPDSDAEPLAPEPEQLALDDDEVRLPWLEGGEDEEPQGWGVSDLAKLAVLGILALALIVGGIWWLSRKSGEEAVVADGSTIDAPDTPYKEKPEDPGGKTFAGTGDTSFAVSEGQNRPVRLGEATPEPAPPATSAPAPGFTSVGKPGAPSGSGATAPAAGSAIDSAVVGVQVGAFSTRASAEAGWTRLTQQGKALSGLRHRIVEGKADIGTVYRLQAVAADAGAARALCASLRSSGIACQVKN
jgi:hypothetical protein